MMLKLTVLMQKKNARGFCKEVLQRDRSMNNFFCFVFITLWPKTSKSAGKAL